MKKSIKYLSFIVTILLSIIFCNSIVSAKSATISVKSNNTAVVGNNITVTVTLSSSDSLGSWDFTIGYDTSLLRLVSSNTESGGQRSVGYASGNGQKSKTYTLVFKTLKSGNASVYVYGSTVYGFDEAVMTTTNGRKTISLRTQAEIEASYSKNNYLSSLKVEGYELNEEFNKDNLEYSLDLDSTIENVNISATVEDKTASITGIGDIALAEGNNKIEINVTAQNGNVRTYIININVEEKNPIIVEIGGNKYTIVKRKNNLVAPENFIETTVTINGEEVPALYNEISKYTLVGLKSEQGDVKLYIYDLDSEKYTLYQELNFNSNKLFLLDTDEIPKGLIKTTININGEEVNAYKFDEDNMYYILYGMNLNTGNKAFYMYDKEEHTIQRYNTLMIDKLTREKDKYLSLVLVLGCVCFIVMLFLLIKINMDYKRMNKN